MDPASRRTEPAKLTRLVRGDLDWIVMKCLEKDRTRRYDTAIRLAVDIQRYLAGEAVEPRRRRPWRRRDRRQAPVRSVPSLRSARRRTVLNTGLDQHRDWYNKRGQVTGCKRSSSGVVF